MSEQDIETQGTDEAAKRIGQAPTTTDVEDPERSSRNTASGSGSQPGQGAWSRPLTAASTPAPASSRTTKARSDKQAHPPLEQRRQSDRRSRDIR